MMGPEDDDDALQNQKASLLEVAIAEVDRCIKIVEMCRAVPGSLSPQEQKGWLMAVDFVATQLRSWKQASVDGGLLPRRKAMGR